MFRANFTCDSVGSMAGALTCAAAVAAEAVTPVPTASGPDIDITVAGSYEHPFTADLDRGGEYSVDRFGVGLSVAGDLTEQLRARVNVGYNFDSFDFSNAVAFDSPDPFGDIHTISVAAIFTLQLSNEWSIFGGPVGQSSREADADFGKSLTGGGVVGITLEASDTLTIGGGLGVVSQLKDDARVFPIVVVDWRLTDTLRLSSQTGVAAGARTGLELVWNCAPKCELALGGAIEFRRFVLANERDIGQEERTPFWLRGSYMISARARVDLVAGLSAGNDIEVDVGGAFPHSHADETDVAAFVGGGVSITF